MRRLKTTISMLLITVMLSFALAGSGCGHKKVATQPGMTPEQQQAKDAADKQAAIDRLNKLKGEVQRLISAANIGVKAVGALKAQANLPKIPALDEAYDLASAELDEIQKTSDEVFELLKTFKQLDGLSKATLLEAFDKIPPHLDKLEPQLQRIANLVVAYLNSKGITDISVTNMQRNCDLARTLMDGSARIIRTYLE
jgi:hypothetical protein